MSPSTAGTIHQLNAVQKDRICDAVDDAFSHQIALTQQLVRYPSLRTQEAHAQELMAQLFQQRGLEVDQWRLDPDELASHPGAGHIEVSYNNLVNVVGTLNPDSGHGRSLILNGHIDVVPEGLHRQWRTDPWGGEYDGQWLYGRGSGDMKAGLVANICALDAVRNAGLDPAGRIHIQSVVEEESTGNGSLSALVRGYSADAAVIPEPEDEMLVRANVGVIWLRVTVEGNPTHPREMTGGFNAIDAAYLVVERLRELETSWNREKRFHRHFEDLNHPINFNLGQIRGGDWNSSVPAWCDVDLRVAFYPGITADEAWNEITDCLDGIVEDEFGNPITTTPRKTGFYAEGYTLTPNSPAEELLQRAHAESSDKEPLRSLTTPGYLDARVFTQYGNIPTLVYGPVSEAIHGNDERVDMESVRKVTKTLALFIAEWVGVRDTADP